MNGLILSSLLLLVAFSGCIDYGAPDWGSKNCSDQVGDVAAALRVHVPATLGEGDSEVSTVGWCVTIREVLPNYDAHHWQVDRKVSSQLTATVGVPGPGEYMVQLTIPDPSDPYCAHTAELERVEHSGDGVVQVTLEDEGVKTCT